MDEFDNIFNDIIERNFRVLDERMQEMEKRDGYVDPLKFNSNTTLFVIETMKDVLKSYHVELTKFLREKGL